MMPSARAVIKPHMHSIPQESNPTEAAANPLKDSSEERKTICLNHQMKHAFRERPKIHLSSFIHLMMTSALLWNNAGPPYNEGVQ